MPDSLSTSVKRALNLVSESLFVVVLVMATMFVLIGMLSRASRLSNVAAHLPEQTQAVVVMNLDEYSLAPNLMSNFMGQELTDYEWFDRDTAMAWVEGQPLHFIQVNSRAQAKTFLKSLMVEGEEMIEHPDYTCYELTQPSCYTFAGSFLVVGSPDALNQLKPGLEGSGQFQNVRHRLPYDSSLFAYVDTASVRHQFLTSLGELSILEPGYLESILRIFPAYGTTVQAKGDQWFTESFIPVDKDLLRSKKFLHPNMKFKAKLLPYSSDGFAFEWSGVELSEQFELLLQHLQELNHSAAMVLHENVENLWNTRMSSAQREAFQILFNEEQYLGWTPEGEFLWLIDLPSKDAKEKADALKDYFLSGFIETVHVTNDKGETIAERTQVSAERHEHGSDIYFSAGKSHFIAVTDKLGVVSNSEEELIAALDRLNKKESPRSLEEMKNILGGVDHFVRLDMTIFPESHIIHLLMPGAAQSLTGVKVFDDGIYNRSILKF